MSDQDSIVTADLYDAHHETVQVCSLQFRSFGKRTNFFGPCATVATFEDHTPVLEALQNEGRGRVLVVDGQGSLNVGIMGDRLAEQGIKNGWIGVIINGAIRDSTGINALPIGVKALGATARRGWKSRPCEFDVPVRFGSVTFRPGDWIYADMDCVIAAPTPLPLK